MFYLPIYVDQIFHCWKLVHIICHVLFLRKRLVYFELHYFCDYQYILSSEYMLLEIFSDKH